MKRAIAISILLSLACVFLCGFQQQSEVIIARRRATAALGTFTLTQKVLSTACTGGSTTCSITVAATTAGNASMLAAPDSNGASITLSSVSGGGTWVVPAGCRTNTAATGTTLCAYNLNETGGATTITATRSSTSTSGLDKLFYYEYAYSGSSVSFDTSNAVQNATSVNPAGAALTLSGAKDVIVQFCVSAADNFTAVTPYGNLEIGSLQAAADLQNTTSGAAPTWTQNATSLTNCAALALKGN